MKCDQDHTTVNAVYALKRYFLPKQAYKLGIE